MRRVENIKMIILLALAAIGLTLLESCNEAGSNTISRGNMISQRPSEQSKLDQYFFKNGDKEFFPVGKWLVNFKYNEKSKELNLVHLNANVSKSTLCKIYINNDTINVSEKSNKADETSPEDVIYALKKVEPKIYTLNINGTHSKIDLRDINSKWNYSLQGNGSILIAMYDEESNSDEK